MHPLQKSNPCDFNCGNTSLGSMRCSDLQPQNAELPIDSIRHRGPTSTFVSAVQSTQKAGPIDLSCGNTLRSMRCNELHSTKQFPPMLRSAAHDPLPPCTDVSATQKLKLKDCKALNRGNKLKLKLRSDGQCEKAELPRDSTLHGTVASTAWSAGFLAQKLFPTTFRRGKQSKWKRCSDLQREKAHAPILSRPDGVPRASIVVSEKQ